MAPFFFFLNGSPEMINFLLFIIEFHFHMISEREEKKKQDLKIELIFTDL